MRALGIHRLTRRRNRAQVIGRRWLRTPEGAMPMPKDLTAEDVQTVHVARHRVVVEPAAYNRAQPLPELRDWRVPPMSKLRLQRVELGRKAFADGLALDDEPAGLPSAATHVREAQ